VELRGRGRCGTKRTEEEMCNSGYEGEGVELRGRMRKCGTERTVEKMWN
jgi:hypothetical protein